MNEEKKSKPKKAKKTPEQIALEKEEKAALKQEEKLKKNGYGPCNPVSNSYGSASTAEYVASYYKNAVIVFHPLDKVWDGKLWKVWTKQA